MTNENRKIREDIKDALHKLVCAHHAPTPVPINERIAAARLLVDMLNDECGISEIFWETTKK